MCNGSIENVLVAAKISSGHGQSDSRDPKLQIWRPQEKMMGNPVYHKIGGDIALNQSTCHSVDTLSNEFNCRPPDQNSFKILGIELSPTDGSRFELYFSSEGQRGFTFSKYNISELKIDFSRRDCEVTQQPQIEIHIIEQGRVIASAYNNNITNGWETVLNCIIIYLVFQYRSYILFTLTLSSCRRRNKYCSPCRSCRDHRCCAACHYCHPSCCCATKQKKI